MLRFSAHAFLVGTESILTPKAIVFNKSNLSLFSSNDFIWSAHTGVHAKGWKDNNTLFPLYLDSLTSSPFWSFKIKSLTVSPILLYLSNILYLRLFEIIIFDLHFKGIFI